MGQPSFYHATVTLSFQVELAQIGQDKSSFLATGLYLYLKKSNFHQKLSYKLSPHRGYMTVFMDMYMYIFMYSSIYLIYFSFFLSFLT